MIFVKVRYVKMLKHRGRYVRIPGDIYLPSNYLHLVGRKCRVVSIVEIPCEEGNNIVKRDVAWTYVVDVVKLLTKMGLEQSKIPKEALIQLAIHATTGRETYIENDNIVDMEGRVIGKVLDMGKTVLILLSLEKPTIIQLEQR